MDVRKLLDAAPFNLRRSRPTCRDVAMISLGSSACSSAT